MTEHIVHINDVEELVIAKYFIEQKLINKKELEHKYSLTEFIQNFIKMNENIAIYNITDNITVVPFYVYKIDNDIYVFFSEKSEFTDKTSKFLKNINYDFSSLKQYSGGNNMLRLKYSEYELP